MKTIWIFLMSIWSITVLGQVDKYLAAIPKYNEASGFEDARYHNMNWKEFYNLEETQEFVDPMNYDSDLMNAALFFAINKYRSSLGLKVLDYEPRLRDAAMIHSDQMVKRNFFDHVNGYDSKLRMPNNRTELCGFVGEYLAENLARMFVDMRKPENYTQLADKVIKSLSQSKDHNKHMIDPKYNKLGCGLIFENKYADGIYYFRTTHNFGGTW